MLEGKRTQEQSVDEQDWMNRPPSAMEVEWLKQKLAQSG